MVVLERALIDIAVFLLSLPIWNSWCTSRRTYHSRFVNVLVPGGQGTLCEITRETVWKKLKAIDLQISPCNKSSTWVKELVTSRRNSSCCSFSSQQLLCFCMHLCNCSSEDWRQEELWWFGQNSDSERNFQPELVTSCHRCLPVHRFLSCERFSSYVCAYKSLRKVKERKDETWRWGRRGGT